MIFDMPAPRRLTHTQKHLVEELDSIMSAANLDYWNILDRDPKYDQNRTIVLEAIMREIVRGEVISQYTLIDEHLGSNICNYVFDSNRFGTLWKTKKFERFNYFILEKMSLMEKLAFVKDVYVVPKAIASDIEAINAIRNALAHAFFPENLRAYRKKRGTESRTKCGTAYRNLAGPHYKGIDIFSLGGVERFLNDSRRAASFLIIDARRKRGKKLSTLPGNPDS
jgi:hypothetical protein